MCTVLLPPGVNTIAVNKYIISYHTKNNFCKRDLVFENIVHCTLYIVHQTAPKSQPEDGFRKKTETRSCHDVLIIFKQIF